MIVLTGTSSGLGSVVLKTILDQNLLPPDSIRISSSSSRSTPTEGVAAGVEIRYGDMKRPETLVQSFAGADALFLVSYPSVGEERYELHRNAIDAAKEAGVKHIIYTSLTFGGVDGEDSTAGVMQAHLKTMRYLKTCGLSWTIIREATYAHLWNNFAGFLRVDAGDDYDVVVSQDGPNSWASREDLGEGTAKIVARWRDYVGKTINLTGPRLLTVSEITKLYTERTGRRVNFRVVGLDEAIAYHKNHKTLPPEQEIFLPNWASWHIAMSNGETNYIDPTLEYLLGRKPKDIEDMVEDLFTAKTNELDTKDFV
jgi:uncharacterized protein YbjT (DUF2867 family)